jgi:hypothetical protein
MRADPGSLGFEPRQFRVRMVACANGAASAARTAGSFANEAAAKAFIRSRLEIGRSSGSKADRHWGENAAGDQICYWIETDQETASVQSTHVS